MSSSLQEYVKAFKDLRNGVLLVLVAYAISAVFMITFLPEHLAVVTSVMNPSRVLVETEKLYRTHGVILDIAGFITLSLILVAGYTMIVPGVSRLARLDPGYSTPTTLMKLGFYVGIPLALVGYVVVIVTVASLHVSRDLGAVLTGLFAGGALILVGGVLYILAFIGIVMLCFNLASRERLLGYKIAGMVFVVALVVLFIPVVVLASNVLDLVAATILYMALAKSYRKHYEALQKQQTTQPSATPT